MKKYLSNILIYVAALFGIVAFIGLFSTPLQIYDTVKGVWSPYVVKAYTGETVNGMVTNKGTFVPVIGFILSLLMSIFLIIESFKPNLAARLTVINTIVGILFFMCAVLVLLTKDLFLMANNYGDSPYHRNGPGPIMSAICSSIAGTLLLIVTWLPGRRKKIDFIEE